MKRLLTEANLTNFTDLITSINSVLDDKEIPQFAGSETNKIRNWFLKQYIKAVKEDDVIHYFLVFTYSSRSTLTVVVNSP